ncbi:T9SS type A sorting domain-containing protein [Chryseobacterium sp.]|uniref:DUF7619 domain-containing protein n=1 Tax=Chryseobacterium sp. TaxID=1871047 RepID=UPI00289DFE98|nr:T9SS type A sorting domain-containing protein [Chryseobacterium sp.]
MKTKLFFLLSFFLLSWGTKAQNISIPDANFKAKLLSASPSNTIAKDLNGNYFKIDANGDGEIQQSEANQVVALEIINNNSTTNPIQDYQGITAFTNAKSINIDYWNIPSVGINISNLNMLEDLSLKFMSYPEPGKVSVSDCSSLKNVKLRGIPLQHFSGNTLIKNIDFELLNGTLYDEIFSSISLCNHLEKLTLISGYLFNMSTYPTLNLSNHQSLKEIHITDLSLGKLDVSHCNLLDVIDLENNGNTSANTVHFGTLDISYCPLFTNLNIIGNSKISGLIADHCPNLQDINCNTENLGSISATNCPQLNSIHLLSLNSHPLISNSPNLTNIYISKYGFATFDATDAVNLEHLFLGSPSYYQGYNTNFFGPLENLIVSSNLKLKSLGLDNHIINQLNINSLPLLQNVAVSLSYNNNVNYTPQPNFSTQFLQSANIQNCPLLTDISFDGQEGLKNITVKDCPNLLQLKHGPENLFGTPVIWNLTNVDIENCDNLNLVDVSFNKISNLKITNTPNLETVNAVRNELTSLDLTNTNDLKTLKITGNKLTNLNMAAIPSVVSLDAAFNTLNTISGTSNNLKNLSLFSNNLANMNIHDFPNLDSLIIGRNKMVDVDFSGHSKIRIVYENEYDFMYANIGVPYANDSNFTKTFNVNNCTNLEMLLLSSYSMEKVFAKNGKNEIIGFTMGGYPNLQYICCDASQIAEVQNNLAMDGITANVNDYCNFTPGGNHNTITGTVRFDENNNGCDANDEVFEHLKLKINNGTTSSETFVKSNGEYKLYSQSGNYTVTAEPENPSLYTVTPSAFTVNFADSNNNISTQNICVTKNGNVKDLEVIFAPITDARPGFDAVYKVIWRNKGNTTLSGNVVVTFDNLRMNFLSSSLPSTVAGNKVTFNFTDVKPYANNSSELTFKINTPTNPTNPVNNGDTLNFNASIPVSGDSNPDDNNFNFQQTVVGSYDPNDITCLEGNTIPSSMVGKYLHYIVNFENTGTAPATNIVVEMDITPEDLDISSLQLQNTSHSSYTKITGNKVEFIMKNINLAASAHGNIALKIKSKNTLVAGDSISNKANIYFDYNYPVETNEAVTTINNATLQTTDLAKNNSVNIFPNPTKGDVNIEADSKIKSIEIYDAQGRIVQKQIGINAEKTKLSIHNANSGMYIFKIITEKETFTKKVIKN